MMETVKKIAAVILTIPVWFPVLAYLLFDFLIVNHDKIYKEFEE